MGLTALLARVATGAPVPVFAVAGPGTRSLIRDFRLRPEIRLVDTPRPASVLLVGGLVPAEMEMAVARVHDAMAHPRATVLWSAGAAGLGRPEGFDDAIPVDGDPVAACVAAYRDILVGRRGSEPPILPDVDPAPWRGVGPYGQGGSGMTGGVPYGRPMAELGPDPDGLRLDVLPVAVGPLFPRFPAGLVVDARLAGDLVLEVEVANLLANATAAAPSPEADPFLRALGERVAIADLELARARAHLRSVAEALLAAGLEALALRALRIAANLRAGDGALVRRLATIISATQVLRWSLRGVGAVPPEAVAGLGAGPVARASGLREDLRLEDPAYRDLGFAPLVDAGGDAAARLRLRLGEAVQSLDLAARAGDRAATATGRVETPRGRLEAESSASERLFTVLPSLLREHEWGDVVATIVSLDLDLEEGPLARGRARPEAAA